MCSPCSTTRIMWKLILNLSTESTCYHNTQRALWNQGAISMIKNIIVILVKMPPLVFVLTTKLAIDFHLAVNQNKLNYQFNPWVGVIFLKNGVLIKELLGKNYHLWSLLPPSHIRWAFWEKNLSQNSWASLFSMHIYQPSSIFILSYLLFQYTTS